MYPSLSDYMSAEDLDFDQLRNEVVSGPSYSPSLGRHENLQQHLGMLEREFVGQVRLKLVHAVLNVLLRRRMRTTIVYRHFHMLWSGHADFLLDTLDCRWLVSACDTICDHSTDPDEARIAILISLFTNTLKLAETERLITCQTDVDPGRIKGRTPIFDGMTAFMPDGGDMPANLLRRIDQTLQSDNLVGMIGREIISRALSADTVFSRLAPFQRRNLWRNYLPQAPEPRLAVPPEPIQGRPGVDRPGYILLNDTGRLGGSFHLGTVYACSIIRQNLARRGLTEVGWANDRARFDEVLSCAARRPELIVLNGEGTLHHGAPRAEELMSICAHAKDLGIGVAVLNSVWEGNPDTMVEALRTLDLVHVRDSVSHGELPTDFPAEITPDVSIQLFLRTTREGTFLPPKHSLAVMDSVVQRTSTALLDFAEQERLPFYAMPVGNLRKMREAVAIRSGPVWPRLLQLTDLIASRTWVTGRFHGLIAALCAGLPVCALSSNTSKIEGCLLDSGLGDACLLSQDWLSAPVDQKRSELASRFKIQRTENFIQRRDAYLEMAAARIDRMFDAVTETAMARRQSP